MCCAVIACRNAKKCEAAALDIKEKTKKTVTPMTCDLGSFKSILAFTKEFNAKYKKLDSLILNAGLGANGFSKTEDNLELSIGKFRLQVLHLRCPAFSLLTLSV